MALARNLAYLLLWVDCLLLIVDGIMFFVKPSTFFSDFLGAPISDPLYDLSTHGGAILALYHRIAGGSITLSGLLFITSDPMSPRSFFACGPHLVVLGAVFHMSFQPVVESVRSFTNSFIIPFNSAWVMVSLVRVLLLPFFDSKPTNKTKGA